MSAPDPFFEARGVSTGVWKARPYIRYQQRDPERVVRKAWSEHPTFAAMIANQSAGRVIPRFAPQGMRLTRVPAELRPDTDVRTGSHWHYHGDPRDRAELLIQTTGNPLPKRWIHSPETMRKHIADVHGGENVQTVHLDEHRGKYVFPPGKGARRLDIHPDSWTRFVNAPRVFFGIEGCIKADAILSAGEAVFSVPSVTLWRAPELHEFATRYLAGRECIIVPDADWYANDLVLSQAWFCRTYLRRLNVNARVAAPPIGGVEHGIKGVDDFLGNGGTMAGMIVLEQERPYGLADWLSEGHGWRKDKFRRNEQLLEQLALHAGDGGTLTVSLRTLARILGINAMRVSRAVADLVECGAISVDKPLATQPQYRDKGLDWVERPTITIRRDLRAETKFRALG